jgi:DNA replication protein DnaC
MNLTELDRALHHLRLGGMAAVLETRLTEAPTETMASIDLISCLVSDELTRRSDRLLERHRKQAGFRDPNQMLDNFDFTFNLKMNRSLVFDLTSGAFIGRCEDALCLGPGGSGKSHLAQAIGQAANFHHGDRHGLRLKRASPLLDRLKPQLEAARRASTPLGAVRTPDPAQPQRQILEAQKIEMLARRKTRASGEALHRQADAFSVHIHVILVCTKHET